MNLKILTSFLTLLLSASLAFPLSAQSLKSNTTNHRSTIGKYVDSVEELLETLKGKAQVSRKAETQVTARSGLDELISTTLVAVGKGFKPVAKGQTQTKP